MEAFAFHWKMLAAMRQFKEQTERITHPFCTENALTPLQLRILLTLHFEGAQTVSGLAKMTCMAGGNNSALCKKLAQDGLVLRARDLEDERQVNISLSDKGTALIDHFQTHCKTDLQQFLDCMSEQDTQVIMAGFTRLIEILENDIEKENTI